MDTKNTVYSSGYKEFHDMLEFKLSEREPYDGVIVCDDDALNFATLYQNDLFLGIPIVFEGVDNVANAAATGQDKNITGIAEVVDYSKNIELAGSLFPNAKNLYMILDNMENGVGIAKQLEKCSDIFENYQVNYINSSEYTKDELCAFFQSLDLNDIVFCISMGQQIDGKIYTETERFDMINSCSHIYLFRFTQSGIGEGLLGGYIVDHEECGRISAQMMVDILNGKTKPSVILETPGKYYFDYSVMSKYGILSSSLPDDS